MSDVFISYASEDRNQAARVAAALDRLGWQVWWDRQIPPGLSFDEVIEEAIDAARCVLVLWTRHSVGSDWVKTEAAEGARRQILVPAMLEPVKLPLEFRRIQAADLSGWDGEDAHPEFAKLVRAIARVAPLAVAAAAPAAPPPVAPPAAQADAPASPPVEAPAGPPAHAPATAPADTPPGAAAPAPVPPAARRRALVGLGLVGVAAAGGAAWVLWPRPPDVDPAWGRATQAGDGAAPGPGLAASVTGTATATAGPASAASSAAPTLVRVPDVTGQTLNAARAAVLDIGLQLSVAYRDSTRSEPGTVLAQKPAPDTETTRGSVVAVVVARVPAAAAVDTSAARKEAERWLAEAVLASGAARQVVGQTMAEYTRARNHAQTLDPVGRVLLARGRLEAATKAARSAGADAERAVTSIRDALAGWPADRAADARARATRIEGEAKTAEGVARSALDTARGQLEIARAAAAELLAMTPQQTRLTFCQDAAVTRNVAADARRAFVADCVKGR